MKWATFFPFFLALGQCLSAEVTSKPTFLLSLAGNYSNDHVLAIHRCLGIMKQDWRSPTTTRILFDFNDQPNPPLLMSIMPTGVAHKVRFIPDLCSIVF